jgi:hypothetical protein
MVRIMATLASVRALGVVPHRPRAQAGALI